MILTSLNHLTLIQGFVSDLKSQDSLLMKEITNYIFLNPVRSKFKETIFLFPVSGSDDAAGGAGNL